jgi:hypothetical protein
MDNSNVNLIEINDNYKKIIENYKSIYTNIKNIFEDIKVLEGVHNIYINSIDMSSLNYSIYVDDIKHQINITQLEYNYINKIYFMNTEKLYRDLFKLYNRITKIILTIFKENKDTVIKIWNSTEKVISETPDFKRLKKCIRNLSDNVRSSTPIHNDNKIFEEIKRQYYSNIIIYDEMNNLHRYDIDDISLIHDNLLKRLDELNLSKELIKMNLLDIKNKTDKGVLGQTFVMDLNGKSDRINVDYNILIKILESIINIHITISEKYKNMAQNIADQVNYNEETSDILSASDNNKKIELNRKNNSIDELFFSKNDD